MIPSKIVIIDLLLLLLAGCATTPPGSSPTGSENPLMSLKNVDQAPRSLAIFVSPNLRLYEVGGTAQGFAGSACNMSFRLAPTIFQTALEVMPLLFETVVLTSKKSLLPEFDYSMTIDVLDLKWRAAGLGSNAAALKVQMTLLRNSEILHDHVAFFESKGNIDSGTMRGCGDGQIATSRAIVKSLEFAYAAFLSGLNKSETFRVSLNAPKKILATTLPQLTPDQAVEAVQRGPFVGALPGGYNTTFSTESSTSQALESAITQISAQRQGTSGTSPGASVQQSRSPSSQSTAGNCNSSVEACTIASCTKSGGRAQAAAKDGCRYVTCTFANSVNNYSVQVLRPAGSNCVAGYIK